MLQNITRLPLSNKHFNYIFRIFSRLPLTNMYHVESVVSFRAVLTSPILDLTGTFEYVIRNHLGVVFAHL